jgi:hypothetical protein
MKRTERSRTPGRSAGFPPIGAGSAGISRSGPNSAAYRCGAVSTCRPAVLAPLLTTHVGPSPVFDQRYCSDLTFPQVTGVCNCRVIWGAIMALLKERSMDNTEVPPTIDKERFSEFVVSFSETALILFSAGSVIDTLAPAGNRTRCSSLVRGRQTSRPRALWKNGRLVRDVGWYCRNQSGDGSRRAEGPSGPFARQRRSVSGRPERLPRVGSYPVPCRTCLFLRAVRTSSRNRPPQATRLLAVGKFPRGS